MSPKPLIGIPAFHISPVRSRSRVALYESYINALAAGGAASVLIPLTPDDDTLDTIYHRLDGLFLAGGDDVNPVRYGQKPHPRTEQPDDRRDEVEIRLARRAVDAHLPLLAVCRGVQTLNVALGGTLIQDITDLRPGSLRHTYGLDQPRHVPTHEVTTQPGSRVSKIVGQRAAVNSFHHQALDRLAPGLCVTAQATDGVIEAIEGENGAFLLGVQWHPEDMYQHDDRMRDLFVAFVQSI